VTRPLLVIFLTIFVNLVGFGIIIPLLPFYAETFGASPIAIGLLFAVFSLAQLVAAPILGDLSDRYGRRPILILSLAGTAMSFAMLALASSLSMLFFARIVDGLSGGNIATARAYVADVTAPKDRAGAYGLIGAAFGLGFIVGPALSAVLSRVSYTAPIWAAAGITVIAMAMAWAWLPETSHRVSAGTGMPFRNLASMLGRPGLRRILLIDFGYWCAFAVFQATFALIAARRFGFDAAQTGGLFAAFAVLGALIQVVLIRPIVAWLGDRTRRHHPGAGRDPVRDCPRASCHRHRARPPDPGEPGQPGREGRRTGPGPGGRERDGKPRADGGACLGGRGPPAPR
jgi:DHA1 family tetracycline resistance protein-like MFS transporter